MMTQISEISELLRNGKSVQQSSDAGGLPITRIETIADWSVNPERVGFAGLTEADCQGWLLEVGDILISHINSTTHLGKCAIYRGVPEVLVHGMNLLVLRVNQEVAYPDFVYQMLASPQFRTQLPQITKNSVNQSSFNLSNFKKLEIPLPPLTEQKRIAGILDAADALRAKRRAALAELDTLLQSTFLDMFGYPVTNPMGWEVVPLSNICNMTQGIQIPRSEQIEEKQTGYERYLYISDFYSDEKPKYVRAIYDHKRVTVDDLIIANTGSPGRVFRGRPGVLSNNLFRVTFDTELISPVFLFHFLSSEDFQRQLQAQMKRGIQSHLGHKTFGAQSLSIPPIQLQHQFTAAVKSILQQRELMHSHLAELDTLFASLQSRAFNGEL